MLGLWIAPGRHPAQVVGIVRRIVGAVASDRTFTLFEVAYSCHLYEQLTRYDVSLERLRAVVPGGVDLLRADHRDAVLRWLREWGCRQFALAYSELSSAQLLDWATAWMDRLPNADVHLVDLDDVQLSECTSAYADLWARPASHSHKGSTETVKTFGPVGTSKALYVTRPRLFPPWDRAIIAKLGFRSGGAKDFERYLRSVATQLRALAEEAGCGVEDLPRHVRRPESSPPKLIDECNWTVITRGCEPPTHVLLKEWLKLTERNT